MNDFIYLQVINPASVINASLTLQYKAWINLPKKFYPKYRRTQKSGKKGVK